MAPQACIVLGPLLKQAHIFHFMSHLNTVLVDDAGSDLVAGTQKHEHYFFSLGV